MGLVWCCGVYWIVFGMEYLHSLSTVHGDLNYRSVRCKFQGLNLGATCLGAHMWHSLYEHVVHYMSHVL